MTQVGLKPGHMLPLLRRVRPDALPENAHYGDDGCDYHPACLTCPLAICRYEAPDGIRGMLNAPRDADIVRLRAQGVPVGNLCEQSGLSRRSVYRILSAPLSSAAQCRSPHLPGESGSLRQTEGRAGLLSETRKEDAYRGVLTPSSVDSGGAEVNTMRVGQDTPVQGLGAPGPAVNATAFQASVQKGDYPPHGHRRTPASSTP